MRGRSLAATGVCLALTVGTGARATHTLATFTAKDWVLTMRDIGGIPFTEVPDKGIRR